MNSEKRRQLVEAAKSRGYVDMSSPRVLVTREEFFDGNDDEGSIGPNLGKHPGVAAFDAAFRTIESMEGVTAVHFAITEIDETYDDIWPFTDTAYIVTRLAPGAFAPVLTPLRPDSIESQAEEFANPPEIPAGFQLVQVWWD